MNSSETDVLVSIIVPVWNTKPHLGELIGSVLAQTYMMWELLLMDDGSTDGSGAECDAFAGQDKRIRVIHRQHAGASGARNAGLAIARGEWVMFMDSDDVWDKRMLETMLSHAADVDVVCCGFRFVPAMQAGVWVTQERYFPSLVEMAPEAEMLFSLDGIYSACTKLYRRSSIVNRFDETLRHAEDLFFNLNYLQQAKGIRMIPDLLYGYRWISELTLGKRFWFDQFELSKQALSLSCQIFSFSPGACTFFRRWYSEQICWHLRRLARLSGIPEAQRLLILQMHLQDDIFLDDGIMSALAGSACAPLWARLAGGDPAQALAALCD